VAGEGDISTDLLLLETKHTRSDRELHGKCLISPEAQAEIQALQAQHPDKSVMLIAEKEQWVLAHQECQVSITWHYGQ
jgi:aconitate hydratase 2/2-methylisocitrate dehydratase